MALTAEPEEFAIDEYTAFENVLLISGWARDPRGIVDVIFDIRHYTGGVEIVLDLERHDDGTVRWRQTVSLPVRPYIMTARLRIDFANESTGTIRSLGFPRNDRTIELPLVFRNMLPSKGTLLEIGSRAQSDFFYFKDIPDNWEYVGFDIHDGPNVDIVGDAHELSSVFPFRRFDAFRAISVFEHLSMPWKVAVELNRVLNVGAIGLIESCQTSPLDQSCSDYFRFSDRAWAALFNSATGFEIVEAVMGEPTFVVPKRVYELTSIRIDQLGYLSSSVIVRKIKNTQIRWNVRVGDMISNSSSV